MKREGDPAPVQAITLSGATTALGEDEIRSFRESLEGVLITESHENYDAARQVWNGMIDRRPALIARCRSAGDVITVVNFARDHNLLVAVRGGGHSVAGHAVCEGGLVVDLSTMCSVSVDPKTNTAQVQAGATWADVDRATQAFGLAVPGGLVSTTGVAGLTLGGGFGWLSRAFGMTCDSLRSATVVTADGQLRTASESSHPDLFWALRGGGGNFGVVTSFEFELHEVGPEVLSGLIFFDIGDAPAALRRYRAVAADAPDAFSCYAVFRRAPTAPFLPTSVHQSPVLALALCHAGRPVDGKKVAAPLRSVGSPLADKITTQAYTDFQQVSDGNWTPGYRDYWKAAYLSRLSDDALDTLVEYADSIPTKWTDFKVAHFGGAIERVPKDATAFPHRRAPFVLNINTRWDDPADDADNRAWTQDLFSAMQPHTTGDTYVNFLGRESHRRIRSAYGTHYQRLARIKATYDPDNLFRMNQNIPPGT